MLNNIMLDLETMGTGPNSAIIAIGAVRFDTEDIIRGDSNNGILDKFYEIVDLKSSTSLGLEIDPDTVMWWMKQSDNARGQFERDGIHLVKALCSFSEWVGDDAIIWGNGAAFDNVILANAYEKALHPQPWKFWNDRCYRTVKNLHPQIEMERVGTYHCAVDDAESQALHLMKILTR